LASPAFISIRSPDRGRKAILTVTATEARQGGIRAIEICGFEEEFFRARDGRA
jgi:hypothetical protein